MLSVGELGNFSLECSNDRSEVVLARVPRTDPVKLVYIDGAISGDNVWHVNFIDKLDGRWLGRVAVIGKEFYFKESSREGSLLLCNDRTIPFFEILAISISKAERGHWRHFAFLD